MYKEKDSWASTCQPGGKYYLTRNQSTIVAFAIGKKWTVSKYPVYI
jgi:Aspartyl aminopeptidase